MQHAMSCREFMGSTAHLSQEKAGIQRTLPGQLCYLSPYVGVALLHTQGACLKIKPLHSVHARCA